MPLFEYTARNSANGQIQKGQVDVKSREEVSAYLRKNRMMLVSVREAPKKMTLGGSLGKARVKIRDIVIFTRQFATMINAGLPLVQSLTHPGRADREQDPQRGDQGRGARRRGRQYAGRRLRQASQRRSAASTSTWWLPVRRAVFWTRF